MKTTILNKLSVALAATGMATLAFAGGTNMPPQMTSPESQTQQPQPTQSQMTPSQTMSSETMPQHMMTMITPQQFVSDASAGGMKEIRLSQLALANTQNPEVRKFATRMVQDHTKADKKLAAIARTKGLDLPATNMFAADDPNWNNPLVTGSQQVKGAYLLTTNIPFADYQDFKHLQSLSGKDFEQAYAGDMVRDHINTVIEFEAAKRDLSDPELQQFAAQTLPTLHSHLQQAQKLVSDLTGPQTASDSQLNGAAAQDSQTATAGGM